MYKVKVLFSIAIILSITSVSYALNVYVDVNSPNDPGTGSYENPFRRIQDGLDSADSNDTVIIAEGVYTGNGNYDLDPNGKSIIIRSSEPNDPNIVANTIIDPNGAGRGFYFRKVNNYEYPNYIISGLTITNAKIANGYGGGIFFDHCNPTIINCIVTNNSALHGGGVYSNNSSPQFKNCTISNNSSTGDGAGLELWWTNAKLTNCIISNNQATGNGGGIDHYFDSNSILINCTIVNNSASSGGGIYCDNSELTIKNSILWANESNTGKQLALVNNASVSVSYCDAQDGQAEIYADAGSILTWDANSNMNTDPCFASFDPNDDPNSWDFHLQSAYGRWDPSAYTETDLVGDGFINLLDFAKFSNFWRKEAVSLPADFDGSGIVDLFDLMIFSRNYLSFVSVRWVFDEFSSPCIDTGDPNSDWNKEPWPNGKRINMGGYGGTRQASMWGNAADFDVSGSVNFVDFAEFSDKWLAQQNCIEDLNADGLVDFTDLGIFAANWLWQEE